MTGIALHGFDIAAVQLELVCNAGVSEAVENHFGEIVFLNQLLQLRLTMLAIIHPPLLYVWTSELHRKHLFGCVLPFPTSSLEFLL